jgi:hypothetical protein
MSLRTVNPNRKIRKTKQNRITENTETVENLWIVGLSPTMTMKGKQLQAMLKAVSHGLSFPT